MRLVKRDADGIVREQFVPVHCTDVSIDLVEPSRQKCWTRLIEAELPYRPYMQLWSRENQRRVLRQDGWRVVPCQMNVG